MICKRKKKVVSQTVLSNLNKMLMLLMIAHENHTCKCGQAASKVGSSSSGSNSAPLGFDEGGNVLNRFPAN